MKMASNFADWLLYVEFWDEPVKRTPGPIELEWPLGEFKPPRVIHADGRLEQLKGPGLICWDFDQTLTTAVHFKGSSRSTSKPNWRIIDKVHAATVGGNKNVVVTARGEQENQLTGDEKHPLGLIPAQKAITDWGLSHYIDSKDVHLLGGAAKGPMVARFAKQYGMKWGVLYDDHPGNVASVNSMQKQGIPVEGRQIQLSPRDFEPGPEGRPTPAMLQQRHVGANGM